MVSELSMKRPINYINGVVEADSLDCNVIRQMIQKAWKGALFPKTTTVELCYNGTNTRCYDLHGYEIAGFVQKTLYGKVWADLLADAGDSGYLHPDGCDGHRFKEVGWKPVGYACYDYRPQAWFAAES